MSDPFAVADDFRPIGWTECSDKYGIQIVFTQGDDAVDE